MSPLAAPIAHQGGSSHQGAAPRGYKAFSHGPALLKRHSKWLLLAEARAIWEASAAIALWPLLQAAPRGDGHSVLVLPGLIADDSSTEILRHYLRGRGYDVHGWEQGRNLGPRRGVEEKMRDQLARLHARTGRKVSVVGWSLGGVYARLLARHAPQMVRNVITLGSPLGGDSKAKVPSMPAARWPSTEQ